SEATSLRREAYQAMRDYYESGAVPDMTEEQFNGEARYMFVGKENRNELALIHAPGLQDILPQLDELANKIRWYKLLVRNSKKALDAEQNTEGKVGNEDTRKDEDNSTEGIRFRGRKSNEEPKTLVGVHNITEDKLHKAVRLGGLANPSIAVIDSSHQQHNGYGEISLVMPSSKINKTTGKNAGTFFGDAYTPRVPIIEKHLTDKGHDLLYQEFRSLPSEFKYKAIESVENWINEGRLSSGLYQAYLHSTGQGISLVYYQNREYPKELADKALEIGNGATRYESLSTGHQYAISSLLLGQDGYPKSIEEYTQDYVESRKARLNELEEKIARGEKVLPRGKMILQRGLDYVNEVGYPDTFLDLGRGLYDSSILEGKLSVDQSNAEAKRIADEQADAFNKWLAGLAEHYQAEELLFDGLRSDGSKKYLPATLENISKAMKKQGLQGTEGDFGFHSFAASLINKAGTLNAIRKGKGQLANEEARKAFDEKWSKVFDKFVLKLKPQWASIGGDYVLNTALNVEPKAYAQKEYGIKLTDEDVTELKAMVNAIRNEMPVPYFETKFERPVGFNEFSSAIIPSNLSEELKHSLKAQGLSIHEYEQGNEEDRQRAFNEAIQPETIRFRRGQELQEVNERFNEQLQAQIDGTLPKGHVYSLGMPSDILQSAGIPNLPIELSAERLEKKASVAYSSLHPFNLPDITDLPQSLANPIAVFNSRTKQGAKVILTELKDKRGNNFVVALQVRKSEHSRKMDVEVNDVRSLYPKDRVGGIIGWINQGLLTWVDKKKATEFLSTQEPNYLGGGNQFNSLSDATKLIKEFEN
ncbi:MAG: hypothetical protein D8B41_05945, partial [Porphyromonas sp.]